MVKECKKKSLPDQTGLIHLCFHLQSEAVELKYLYKLFGALHFLYSNYVFYCIYEI